LLVAGGHRYFKIQPNGRACNSTKILPPPTGLTGKLDGPTAIDSCEPTSKVAHSSGTFGPPLASVCSLAAQRFCNCKKTIAAPLIQIIRAPNFAAGCPQSRVQLRDDTNCLAAGRDMSGARFAGRSLISLDGAEWRPAWGGPSVAVPIWLCALALCGQIYRLQQQIANNLLARPAEHSSSLAPPSLRRGRREQRSLTSGREPTRCERLAPFASSAQHAEPAILAAQLS